MRIPAPAARVLSRHVSHVVARLDPARYEQEAAYVAALFARLDAVVDHSPDFTLELKSTVVTDRGPNSAESRVPPPNATQPVILVAEPLPLGRYLHAQLLRCLHGDQRRELVEGLATSSLTSLRIEARTVQ
jgi:hypothetical protein